jgi:hypothetical protein
MRARAIIEGEASRFLRKLGKVKPSITDKDRAALEAARFFLTDENKAYVEYRQFPVGWGQTGEDRQEAVTFFHGGGGWSASALHLTPQGNAWYEDGSGFVWSSAAAVAWVEQDRQHAPKLPPRHEAVRKGAARQFIMGQPRLRRGDGWTLWFTFKNGRDEIPVEILPGNWPNTQDAPYHLGMAVEHAITDAGHDPDEIVDHDPDDPTLEIDREMQEMDRYWQPIYAAIKQAKLSGTANGIIGPCRWELVDDTQEE